MFPLVRVLFGVAFFAIFTFLNVYLYRRLVRDVTEEPWLRRLAVAVLALGFAAIPAVRWLGARYESPTLAATLMSWWGFVIHVLLVLVGLEFGRWLWRRRPGAQPAPKPASGEPQAAPLAVDDPARRLFLARTVAGAAAGTSAVLSTYGAYRAFTKPELTELPIRLRGLPKALDGFTLIQLTDIHVGAVIQSGFLDQLVEVSNAAKPDLVAITGDLVDGPPSELLRYVQRLGRLQSRWGTHFVSGNHDYYSGWERWAPELERLGFVVLRNRAVRIGDAGASFDLLGVEDWGSRMSGGEYDLDKATEGLDPARASVLLAHQPQNVEAVAAKGIGLQLSGHTHGGQLFPATLVGQAIWGSLNAGLSRVQDTYVYTSRGCGFVGPPMRIGAPPEVVKVILTAA